MRAGATSRNVSRERRSALRAMAAGARFLLSQNAPDMSETKQKPFKVIEGDRKRACPQCKKDIPFGKAQYWFGDYFCSESCGKAFFKRKSSERP